MTIYKDSPVVLNAPPKTKTRWLKIQRWEGGLLLNSKVMILRRHYNAALVSLDAIHATVGVSEVHVNAKVGMSM